MIEKVCQPSIFKFSGVKMLRCREGNILCFQVVASEISKPHGFRVQNDELGWVFSPSFETGNQRLLEKNWHHKFAWQSHEIHGCVVLHFEGHRPKGIPFPVFEKSLLNHVTYMMYNP